MPISLSLSLLPPSSSHTQVILAKASSSSKNPGSQAIEQTQRLYSAVTKLVSVVEKHVDDSTEQNLVFSMLITMSSKCTADTSTMKRIETRMLHDVNRPRVLSVVQEAYNKKYYTENLVNDTLNFFTANVRKSYEGENTVLAQLGHARKGTETREYSEDGGKGDEALPCGLEFQNFVRTFVEYSVTGDWVHMREIHPVMSQFIYQFRASEDEEDEEELSAKQIFERDNLTIKALQVLALPALIFVSVSVSHYLSLHLSLSLYLYLSLLSLLYLPMC
jgi:hypothetical protein